MAEEVRRDEIRRAKVAFAKRKYAEKVCDYLGLNKEACERVFEKLYANMKTAFKAFLPATTAAE